MASPLRQSHSHSCMALEALSLLISCHSSNVPHSCVNAKWLSCPLASLASNVSRSTILSFCLMTYCKGSSDRSTLGISCCQIDVSAASDLAGMGLAPLSMFWLVLGPGLVFPSAGGAGHIRHSSKAPSSIHGSVILLGGPPAHPRPIWHIDYSC